MSAHFGLDIGSFSIKAVQLEKKGKVFKLIGLGEVRTPVNIASQSETDKRALATVIKKIVDEAGITTKKVDLCLPETSAYSQVIELPYLSDTELASAINYEAEQYVPIPLEEVKLEYLALSTFSQGSDRKKMEVLLIAAQKFAIDRMLEICSLVGLAPNALETEGLSLVRSANSCFSGNCLVLNIGLQATTIIILQHQELRLIRTLNTGGEAFTRTIARELNLEPEQAEQYKAAYGLNKDALEGKVAKSISPIFDVVINEVNKALNFFLQKNPSVQLRTILVSGGGALMPGLNIYLAQALNMEVISFDPFKSLTPDKRIGAVKGRGRFAAAVGLAMREE